MNQLETLLHRYKEGVITPDEQAELDLLTHRQEVLDAASSQATSIRRRRRIITSSMASLLIVAGITYTVWSSQGTSPSDGPILAQNRESHSPTVIEKKIIQESSLQTNPQPRVSPLPASNVNDQTAENNPVDTKPTKHLTTPGEKTHTNTMDVSEMEPASIPASETIVACNTQCSPDSVINDIWNFLKA